MRKLIGLLLIYFLFIACESKKPLKEMTNQEKQEQKKTDLAKMSLEIENPVKIGKSDYIIFPLRASLMLSRDRALYSSVYEKGNAFTPLWNMIFFNKKTGEQRLLLENEEVIIMEYKSTLIKGFEGELKDTINNFIQNLIFYEMKVKDYNQDKKLNLLDPSYLYISDNIGKNLRRLSPPNHHLIAWYLPWEDNHLIIKTLRDNNGDKLFDTNDKDFTYYLIDILNPKNYQEIMGDKFKTQLKNLYLDRKNMND